MSNLIAAYLSQWLSKVIKNYTCDQLNVSLKKGKVNLEDFEVDVNVVNIYLQKYIPFLKISKIAVSNALLELPSYLQIKKQPIIVRIGDVDVELTQHDFTQPSAIEVVRKEWFEPTSHPKLLNRLNGIIRKIIDGVRIEINSIHLVCKLDGLPCETNINTNNDETKQFDTSHDQKIDEKNENKNSDHKLSGQPLIMETWVKDCIICQTNSKWEISNNLNAIRKEQGTHTEDFCVYKLFKCDSLSLQFMPHSNRKDCIQILENYATQVKFITQRCATTGVVKSVSIDWLIDTLHIYITRDEWFEINYWMSSLIYAQSKQYEHELTPKTATQEEKDENSNDEKLNSDDEDQYRLCQPPKFEWNKLPGFTTFAVRSNSLCLCIMPNDSVRQPNQQIKQPTMTNKDDYKYDYENRTFLQCCNLRPFTFGGNDNYKLRSRRRRKKYRHLNIGDKFIYTAGRERLSSHNYKPLVMAVVTGFTFGSIFPDVGCSIWGTKIGKKCSEQFFSIQLRDMNILADTNLKSQIQKEIITGFEQVVTQLQQESNLITQNKDKSDTTASSPVDNDTMMLLISSRSRHSRQHTFSGNFEFSVSSPFPGYTSETATVFNFQWTRRLPTPKTILGSVFHMHVKPISIYLDPFLFYNVVNFFIGNGVLKCYQILTHFTSTATFANTTNRSIPQLAVLYQLDSLTVRVPMSEV